MCKNMGKLRIEFSTPFYDRKQSRKTRLLVKLQINFFNYMMFYNTLTKIHPVLELNYIFKMLYTYFQYPSI